MNNHKFIRTKYERVNHGRVFQRLLIDEFRRCKGIINDAACRYDLPFPDYINSSNDLCIEETSIINEVLIRTCKDRHCQCFTNSQTHLYYYSPKNFVPLLKNKIKKSIKAKDNKGSYKNFVNQFGRRILLCRVYDPSGMITFEELKELSLSLRLKPKLFNEIYITIFPIIPTKGDISTKKVPPFSYGFIQLV